MNKAVIALTFATVASAGAATHLWQTLGDEREERAQLLARVAELERSQTAVVSAPVESDPAPPIEEPPPAPANPPPLARSAVNSTGPAPAVFGFARAGAPDPEMMRRMQQSHEQQMRMLKDPEYRELMRAQHRLGMQQAYSDLGPLMGLTDDESERLLDLLAEHSIRNMERQRPMFDPMNGPPNEARLREVQRSFEEQRKNNEAEIAALLGPKYNDWQQYQQNGWARGQVTRLRQTLGVSDDPLRHDQIKPLVEAIARERQQLAAPAMSRSMAMGLPAAEMQARWAEDMLERTKQSHERVRLAVSGLLSPLQYEQLQRQQEHELKMQELQVRQQRARAEAQARGELPPDAGFPTNTMISIGPP